MYYITLYNVIHYITTYNVMVPEPKYNVRRLRLLYHKVTLIYKYANGTVVGFTVFVVRCSFEIEGICSIHRL